MQLRVFHTISGLREALAARQASAPAPQVVGCVPTMGHLHAGHLALVRQARSHADLVVVTVFVNRLQFLPHEDFDRYPRTLESDCEKLQALGIAPEALWVFAPQESELYPTAQTYKVHPPAELADILEGHFRPGFFVGVCTVVMKLFACVQPQVAVFGKKDYQQLMVVERMVAQFALPVEIVAGPIERAEDGLALSSRNVYLSEAQRAQAVELSQSLQSLRHSLLSGTPDVLAAQQRAQEDLARSGWVVDYVTVRRRTDLQAPSAAEVPALLQGGLVILAAAKLGTVRLIDNLEV